MESLTMSGSRSLFAGLTVLAALAVAGPAAAENVLRFTGKDAWAATMDPHSYSNEDNKGATYQVYEALLDIESNLAIVPQLALAWNILRLSRPRAAEEGRAAFPHDLRRARGVAARCGRGGFVLRGCGLSLQIVPTGLPFL